jgi:hypothetical protein
MMRVSDDSSLADQLKVRGMVRSSAFTWDACAEKTRAIYRQIA